MANLRVPVNFTGGFTAADLINHLAGSSLTVCVCAYIVSTIGATTIGITSHSSDLTSVPGYPGVTFKSTTGVTASKVEYPGALSAWNMEADLFMVAAGISEADALAGKWARAPVTVFVTNYESLNMGQLQSKGFLSEFRQMGQMLVSEINGFNKALQQQIGRVTKPECDADYGDARCGRDLVALGEVKTVTVTSVPTAQLVFRDSSRAETGDYFDNAKGVWLTGSNAGFPIHVGTWTEGVGQFALRTPTPYTIQIGDTASINRGCQKREADCIARDNIINMRAFPHMPTLEQIQRLPQN